MPPPEFDNGQLLLAKLTVANNSGARVQDNDLLMSDASTSDGSDPCVEVVRHR